MTSPPSKPLRIALLVLRLALGAVFLYAAWTKLRQPWMLFAMSVDAYHVLPQWAVIAVARGLPWLELLLGLLLISGFWRRIAMVGVSGLLLVFFGLMVRAYAQGQTIDCGCFGPGEQISWITLGRDGGLLAASLFLTVMSFRARKARPSGLPGLAGSARLASANLRDSGDFSA